MGNEERVKELLLELQQNLNSNEKGVKASDIAKALGMHRSAVSMYLNKMVTNGIVTKTNTRPVYFNYILSDALSNEIQIEDKDPFNNVIGYNASLSKQIETCKSAVVYPNNGMPIILLGLSNEIQIEDKDPFNNVIGYNASLSKQIETCKSAVVYPNNGMPIILLGDSGVGKSFLAEVIYDYALFKNVIEKDAPFVVFNCADYANNPELLSAYLFGYKKGAFTGADKDTRGLIEEADGGFLFLDEVHRLSPEGQEKLFLLLDKGIYRRIGDSNSTKGLNVRFIFATTENPDESLLETFLRRITIQVRIPSYNEREIGERLELIHHLFSTEARDINKDILVSNETFLRRITIQVRIPSYNEREIGERLELIHHLFSTEARDINKDILVSNAVINILLDLKSKGNVGKLKNIIKVCCANSYLKCNDSNNISINIEDLPSKYIIESKNILDYLKSENMLIKANSNRVNFASNILSDENNYNEDIEGIYKVTKRGSTLSYNKENLTRELRKRITGIVDKCLYKSGLGRMEEIENFYQLGISEALKVINDKYGTKYQGNTEKVLARIFIEFKYKDSTKDNYEYERYILRVINSQYSRVSTISNMFLKIIGRSLDYKISNRLRIITILYFLSITDCKCSQINGIILAHGYSTASSIASLTNNIYEEFIFESFDMPFDIKPKEVIKQLIGYLKTIDTSRGVLLLVDMGSLFTIGDEIKNYVEGDIGIINNITTQIALDVGSRIINNEKIESIVRNVKDKNTLDYYFAKKVKKKKAIIVTCISGIGTAIKLRDLMRRCIDNNEVEIIETDYNNLIVKGQEAEIFNEYDVKLIVSTIKVNVGDYKTLILSDIVTTDGKEKLKEALNELGVIKSVDIISNNIIKYFSFENIINQLTILNPTKVIEYAEDIIFNIERDLNLKINENIKAMLYVHLSLLIERLVIGDNVDNDNDYIEFSKCNKKFVKCVKNSFSVIEKQYNISINITEIYFIYEIINQE